MMMIYGPWALESSKPCLLGLFALLFCLFVCFLSQPIVLTLDSPVLHRLRCENYGFPRRFLLFSYFCRFSLVIFQKHMLPERYFFALKFYFSLIHRQGLLLPRARISSSGGLILAFVNGHLHYLVIWFKN